MLAALYRALLRLLPASWDGLDRREMEETYEARVGSAAGRGRGAALRLSLFEIGDLAATVVSSRLPHLLDSLRQDALVGTRSLFRTPLVSGLAVLSLALGIGGTSSVFAALDVWFWRPLPTPNADRLYRVTKGDRERGWDQTPLYVRDFLDLREGVHSVELALYAPGSPPVSLAIPGGVEVATTLVGSPGLLGVLGVKPVLGRGFLPEEEHTGATRPAILTDAFWASAFARDPGVLGTEITLDGEPATVVGVLPPGLVLPGQRPDVWVPLRVDGPEADRGNVFLGMALLPEGTTPERARAELQAVWGHARAGDPDTRSPDAFLTPLRTAIYPSQEAWLLAAPVLILLLVACANIASLLLARGLGRSHEMSVRDALGASRGRLVRQLLVESLVLATAGGVLGVAVAGVGIRLLLTYVLPQARVPGWEQIGLDGRVVLATVGIAVASALLFGLVPSLRSSRVDARAKLSDGGQTGATRRLRLGHAMVVAQVTLAFTLLVSAGLVLQSLVMSYGADMGFRTDDAISFAVAPTPGSHTDEVSASAFHRELTERILALPGVLGVTSSSGPLGSWSNTPYTVPGAAVDSTVRLTAWDRVASETYQDVMGMRMASGRWFDDDVDVFGGVPVAVVSLPIAERHWGGAAEALGRRIGFHGGTYEIVGVVDVGRLLGPQQPSPSVVFEAASQRPVRHRYYVVDAASNQAALVPGIREAVRSLDSGLAIYGVETLRDQFREMVSMETALLRIFGTLAVLTLVLTFVGIYGVMAHSVARRSGEIGIRMALGARRGRLLTLVLGQSGKLTFVALVLGIGLSLAAGRGMSSFVVGLRDWDPIVLAGASSLVFAAALLASWIPARRAARVDPVDALRKA